MMLLKDKETVTSRSSFEFMLHQTSRRQPAPAGFRRQAWRCVVEAGLEADVH
jgi:hypothetical protein